MGLRDLVEKQSDSTLLAQRQAEIGEYREMLLAEVAAGLVSPTGLTAGTLLQDGMLQSPPALLEGEREFAMTVDAESGVAGQLQPEDLVDVVAAFAGEDAAPAEARAIVVGARVLTVTASTDNAGAQAGAQTVTLAVPNRSSLDIAYAQSFAERVRLTLVPPGTTSEVPDDERSAGRPGVAAPEGEQ